MLMVSHMHPQYSGWLTYSQKQKNCRWKIKSKLVWSNSKKSGCPRLCRIKPVLLVRKCKNYLKRFHRFFSEVLFVHRSVSGVRSIPVQRQWNIEQGELTITKDMLPKLFQLLPKSVKVSSCMFIDFFLSQFMFFQTAFLFCILALEPCSDLRGIVPP